MAYDAEANVSFACPGHQGGEFYRKSPAGQLFFKHFGEQIFRNDLCNADVELGDLLIHVGAAVDAQRHAAQVFGADRTYFVLNGTSTSNKVVTQATSCARRPRAVRSQQPQVAAPGRAGQGRRDPDFPADCAQSVRHDRRRRLGRVGREIPARTDPQPSAGEGSGAPQGRAAVPDGLHPARDLRRHDLQRAQGHGEDRPPLRLRAVGRSLDRLQRISSAVQGSQPDAAREARRRRWPGCSRRSPCTSRARDFRRPRRSTSATSTSGASGASSSTSASTSRS